MPQPNETHYDAIVIGGGMAGLPVALKLSRKGFKVALVERDKLGGTCLNRGCIPTKTMIASAKVAYHSRCAKRWGVLNENVRVDLGLVVDRKDELVNSVRSGAEKNVEKSDNLTLIRGDAHFTDSKTLQVNGATISGERIFINTGTRGFVPPITGLQELPYLDSTTGMELRELPRHLLVVGGGYVGVEFAQMYHRFGSDVTIIQQGPQLLPQEDEEIARSLEKVLAAEGIEILLGASAARVKKVGDEIILGAVRKEGEQELRGSHLLIAAGRTPNTDSLNLAATGVETDERGFIKVDGKLGTSVPGIWALGDARGGPMFTHTARDDARIVYENIVNEADLSTEGRAIPYAVFSDPQLGRIGMTEREARNAGHELKIGRYEGRKVAKARAIGEAEGLIKVVADAKSDKILGAAVLLAEGAEIVHQMIAAVQLGARYTDLTDMIHIHPTLAEGLSSALGGVHFEEGI
jgi:dihydrolipoamide dehydrogenase